MPLLDDSSEAQGLNSKETHIHYDVVCCRIIFNYKARGETAHASLLWRL